MNTWQTESLRLTVFRPKPIETVIPLWEKLAGDKPETVDSQPRANMISETGAIELGALTHVSNPLTINWILSPSVKQQEKVVSFATIGPFLETKEEFVKMMLDWLGSGAAPEINRIALGSVSIVVSDNKSLAYKQLSSFLHHVEIDTENSSDFFYQINRPVLSTVDADLVINRLSKWSSLRFTGVGLFFGETMEVLPDSRAEVASRLELDINTSQNNKQVFSSDKVKLLLPELSKLADQISTDGDK